MTPAQHKKRAEEILAAYHDRKQFSPLALAAAQVHATLALYRAPSKSKKES